MEQKEMENMERDVTFLDDISTEVKNMCEIPVIHIMKKDYSEIIFNAMCDIRSALYEGSINRIIDIIVDYHLQWLHYINELDNLKKRVCEMLREEVYQAISYTIDSIGYRLKRYLRYMEKNRPTLTITQQININADLEIVEKIHSENTTILLEKLKCFRNDVNDHEFTIKLIQEVDELQQWIDNINNRLSFLLCKYFSNKMPHLGNDLTKTLQQVVHEIITSSTGQKITVELENKGIFDHRLPSEDRERLISELCYLWDLAIFGETSHKSIISILSAADMKEENIDELGTFYIDEHSRKIYKAENDTTLYQPNERNELVPLTDDSEHIYFYDECGRYYIEANTRQRIYKAHASASEYMMDSTGILLKFKEVRDGIVYHYDHFGRYYINADGKQIYREDDSTSEYENDGLGNLVRIRSHTDIFEACPDDIHMTEDSKYLKQSVGLALRQCIANCIMCQPADPIEFLSLQLLKYRENLETREKKSREKEALDIEREIRIAEDRDRAERAALEVALHAQEESEASYDSNLMKYTSAVDQDDKVSSDVSTK